MLQFTYVKNNPFISVKNSNSIEYKEEAESHPYLYYPVSFVNRIIIINLMTLYRVALPTL